jgi:adenosylmethionine-8-amino-7-oxononanoate aminotransferase
MELFEKDKVIENNKTLSAVMGEVTAPLADHPHVGDVRQHGMVVAMEMVKNKTTRAPYPWQERRGLTVYRHGLKNEVLLRPLGNVVYFMPPYVISEEQIRMMARVAAEGIDLATGA